MNEGDKHLRIRDLLKEWKAGIVGFLETKLEVMSFCVVQSLWGCHHVNWTSREASGGILIMWDRRSEDKIDVCVGEFDSCMFIQKR